MGLVTSIVGLGDGAGPGRGARGGVWKVEVKASFAAQFWSTTWAMVYHASGLASEGLLEAMVVMEFWIWA